MFINSFKLKVAQYKVTKCFIVLPPIWYNLNVTSSLQNNISKQNDNLIEINF